MITGSAVASFAGQTLVLTERPPKHPPPPPPDDEVTKPTDCRSAEAVFPFRLFHDAAPRLPALPSRSAFFLLSVSHLRLRHCRRAPGVCVCVMDSLRHQLQHCQSIVSINNNNIIIIIIIISVVFPYILIPIEFFTTTAKNGQRGKTRIW